MSDGDRHFFLKDGLAVVITQFDFVITRPQCEFVVVSQLGRKSSVDVDIGVLLLVVSYDLHFTKVCVSRRVGVVVAAIGEERIVKEWSVFHDDDAVPELCRDSWRQTQEQSSGDGNGQCNRSNSHGFAHCRVLLLS